jgi:integrase
MTEYINFTKTHLDGLSIIDKPFEVADTKVPGLRLRLNANSTKTYFLYRKVMGQPQRVTVGRYSDLTLEQARKEAVRLNSVIALGGNPMTDRKEKRTELTFKQLYDHYYQEYALYQTRRPLDNKKTIDYHITPVFGNLRLNEITTEKIQRFHTKLGATKKSTANRVIHVVSAAFNFGIRQGYHKGLNPCVGIQKYKLISRDRFLSREELRAFFAAVELERRLFRDYFLLALYTGARKSNVLSMRWADIDFELKRWRISAYEAKNGDVNIVVLSDNALVILRQRYQDNQKLVTPSSYVFPGDKDIENHLKDPKRAFERIKTRMNTSDIRIHDLRRTLASYMAINGASLPMIGQALNHKSQVSTAIYARLSQNPVLDAVNHATLSMSDSLP